MKNTKAKVSKHWFESRNHGKSQIFAIHSPKDEPEQAIKVQVDRKLAPNMAAAKRVLEENGKLSVDDAAKKLLEIHKLRTDNFEQARKIFLHASKHGVPVKITTENKVKYIELIN